MHCRYHHIIMPSITTILRGRLRSASLRTCLPSIAAIHTYTAALCATLDTCCATRHLRAPQLPVRVKVLPSFGLPLDVAFTVLVLVHLLPAVLINYTVYLPAYTLPPGTDITGVHANAHAGTVCRRFRFALIPAVFPTHRLTPTPARRHLPCALRFARVILLYLFAFYTPDFTQCRICCLYRHSPYHITITYLI